MARPPSDTAFSDSDWTSEEPAAPERRDPRILVALAAGVAIGALGATLLWWLAGTATRPTHSTGAPEASVPTSAAVATPAATTAIAPGPAASEPTSAPPVGHSAPASAVGATATAADAPSSAPASEHAMLGDEAARRKESAWRKFYQPPSICSEDKRGDFMVECANHSIRARKEFEERYATGRL